MWSQHPASHIADSYALHYGAGRKLEKKDSPHRTPVSAEFKRAYQESIRSALLSSAIGVAATDADGRFVSVNRAFCRITGYSERELLCLDWFSLTHPDDRQRNIDLGRRALESELSSFVMEKRYVTKSGPTVWARISVLFLFDDREYRGAIALVEDITELKQAEKAQRALSGRLLRLQDEERRRFARELHDSTAQNLAALVITLAPLKKELPKLAPASRKAFSTALLLAKEAAREVRTVSYLLHPPLLEELGFPDALRCFVRAFNQRSGIQAKLHVDGKLRRLPQEMEIALFRIVQESLNNVRVHSGSSRAVVTLRSMGRRVQLSVRDFGRGLKMGSRAKSLGVGIAGMRERVEQLGGKFEVHSSNSGTLVKAVLPLTPPA
jgi:two-component system, NarL family, sensor kinase